MSQRPGITALIEEIRQLDPDRAAERLAAFSADDIQFILSRLDTERALAIASHLAEDSAEAFADMEALLTGKEETIRELLAPAPAVLPASYTAAEAIAFLVKTKEIADITYIYVTDNHRLVGVLGMRDLILAKPAQTMSELMVKEPYAFYPETTVQEAVTEALYRHYPMYPVVNDEHEIIGIVRGWKLYERVASEISGQAGAQVGLAREEKISTGVIDAFRMRHPWLQVNLITAFAAAFVVGMFEDTIARVVALAVFLPVLAGQSGNTGSQALAITLRGMTLGQLRDYPIAKILRKEILLGALNGFLVGIVAGMAMFGYALATDATAPVMLGVVILIAMVGACMGSGIFGVMVPLTLKRFGADPAMASSIFLTTFTDIIGMGLMLFLATVMIL